MIALCLLVATVLAIFAIGDALDDDRAPQGNSGALDALLFVLCLAGILRARQKRDEESDEE